MNTDELFKKYSIETFDGMNLMDKENFTKAIAEIIGSPVEPEVIPKAMGIWVTFDEYEDIETEFIYPETEEGKMPYQLGKYLMNNKNKTAKRLNCFTV